MPSRTSAGSAPIACTAPGQCGTSVPSCSWKLVSKAMIAVAGAVIIFSRLPSSTAGARRALASALLTNTTRAG